MTGIYSTTQAIGSSTCAKVQIVQIFVPEQIQNGCLTLAAKLMMSRALPP